MGCQRVLVTKEVRPGFFMSEEPEEIDLYIPFFLLIKFVFFMGWLQVASSLFNPFGNDDDDFPLEELIDRHLNTCKRYIMDDNEDGDIADVMDDDIWNEEQQEPERIEGNVLPNGPPVDRGLGEVLQTENEEQQELEWAEMEAPPSGSPVDQSMDDDFWSLESTGSLTAEQQDLEPIEGDVPPSGAPLNSGQVIVQIEPENEEQPEPEWIELIVLSKQQQLIERDVTPSGASLNPGLVEVIQIESEDGGQQEPELI